MNKNLWLLVCLCMGLATISTKHVSAAAQSSVVPLDQHPHVVAALARAGALMPAASAPSAPMAEALEESQEPGAPLPAVAVASAPAQADSVDIKEEAAARAQTACLYCKGAKGSLEFGDKRTILAWPCGHRSHIACVSSSDSLEPSAHMLLPYSGNRREINIGSAGECGICLETLAERPTVILDCAHIFCLKCYLGDSKNGCAGCRSNNAIHNRYRKKGDVARDVRVSSSSSSMLNVLALEDEITHGGQACPDCRFHQHGRAPLVPEQKMKKSTPAARATMLAAPLAPAKWDVGNCVVCNIFIEEDRRLELPPCTRFKATQGFNEHHGVHRDCADALVSSGYCTVCNRGLSKAEELRYSPKVATAKHAYARSDEGKAENYKKYLQAMVAGNHMSQHDAKQAYKEAGFRDWDSTPVAQARSKLSAPAAAVAALSSASAGGQGAKSASLLQVIPDPRYRMRPVGQPLIPESRHCFESLVEKASHEKGRLLQLVENGETTEANARELFNRYGIGDWDLIVADPVSAELPAAAVAALPAVQGIAQEPVAPGRIYSVPQDYHDVVVDRNALAAAGVPSSAPAPVVDRPVISWRTATVATWFAASWLTRFAPAAEQRRARAAVAAAALPVAMIAHANSPYYVLNVLKSTLLMLGAHHFINRR